MNRRPRPLIALVMPWQFGPGGAQRYVVDLALWASRFAQVHIVYHGSDDPTWQAICRPAGIALNACNGPAGIEQLLRALQPDLIHHHYPAQTQAIAGLIGKVPLVGTSHGWDANHELPTWGVPIVGDFPNVIRTGVDLDRYHPNAEAEKRGKQPFRVGIVGCMGFEKYPFDFLKSLAGWKPENVALYCFGRGGFHNGRKIIEDALTAMNWPVLVGEVTYEGHMMTNGPDIQRFMFWSSMLNGAAGHTYGAGGIWQMNSETERGAEYEFTPWSEAMKLPGSTQLGLGKKLLEKYPW